ncbi:DUF4209 domain-containing protein [Christiangramia salexigens]|uniref:DUF4209 domain-containing protein n=1 Tax=Christiangramia salexigens TaxID=1913577 RepID=A0A1L3J403_9FLAO|nr:DUF4209 domain-containing protein [Christiangramia salexigens]APG59833.1 hypothetical protein LPB144_05120 [Christiangramia salexigens]
MFETFADFYKYQDNDKKIYFELGISNQLTALRDKLEKPEKENCSYEIYFADFNFRNGEYVPLFSNGENQYPDKSQFNDFDYIEFRTNDGNLENPKYLAKYNHLLWESPRKNIKFAKKAIDNYLVVLQTFQISLEDNLSQRGYSEVFKNFHYLSEKINYRKIDCLNLLIKEIEFDKLNGFIKFDLIAYVLSNRKKIDQKDLNLFLNFSNKVIHENTYPDLKEEYLKLLIQLASKLNKSSKKYLNDLGEYYLKKSKDYEGSFVVHDFLIKSLQKFQKAGNKQRVEEVTVLIEKEKDNLNFKLIQTEHTSPELQKWFDTVDKFTDDLIENYSSKEIFEFIILSKDIFPSSKTYEKKIQKSPLMDLMTTMNFDINRNVSNNKNNGLNSYLIQLNNFSIRFLGMIFSKGIKCNKITSETLCDYLRNNSWIGRDIKYTNPDGKEEKHNWLDLLAPGLIQFFQQSEIDIKSNSNNSQGYILSIDSLTLKFEGIVREFSRKIGAQTIEFKDNGTQERISFEKLLENEKFKKTIPEDDLALFKFLYLSYDLNLRNNIAHSFYKVKDYSSSIVLLIISSILKIGNYKFEESHRA